MNSSLHGHSSLEDEINSTITNDGITSDNIDNQRRQMRLIFMSIDALSLIFLLILYMVVKKVKNTMLGKLMKCYSVFALVALLTYFLYTLMEFRLSVPEVVCYITIYVSSYSYIASVTSRVLFLFHICFIFYNVYKMILKDITDQQLHRLQTSYVTIIIGLPLLMIVAIIFYNHILFNIHIVEGDYCLSFGLFDPFTIVTMIGIVVLIHIAGIVMIIALSYLLYKAYKMQKKVGHDSKRLLRIALGVGVAFGMAWIIYALWPLYKNDPVAPVVVYSTAALENVMIMAVFFYSNEILLKLRVCIRITNNCSMEKHININLQV